MKPDGVVSFEAWQAQVMETAEFPREDVAEAITILGQKAAFETIELVADTSADRIRDARRFFVLSPKEHDSFFDATYVASRYDHENQAHVAGEFGDVLWYMIAMLDLQDISMSTVADKAVQIINNDPEAKAGSIKEFNELASKVEPFDHGTPISEMPFVVYSGSFVANFIHACEKEPFTEQVVERAARLLWATTYLSDNYCSTGLSEVISNNYQKLQMRAAQNIPQGQGVGDDRFPSGI